MVNQFLGFFLVKCIYATIFVHSNTLFQDFNWIDFHSNIGYYYLPKGLQQTYIIYVFAGLSIGVIIQLIINRVKAQISEMCNRRQWKKQCVYSVIGITISVISCSVAYGISNYVQERGGVVLKNITNYTLGDIVRFDKTGRIEKYVISGFSTPEDLYTWTDGYKASLGFIIRGNNDNDLDLEYKCNIFLEKQRVDIYVNGNYLQTDTI